MQAWFADDSACEVRVALDLASKEVPLLSPEERRGAWGLLRFSLRRSTPPYLLPIFNILGLSNFIESKSNYIRILSEFYRILLESSIIKVRIDNCSSLSHTRDSVCWLMDQVLATYVCRATTYPRFTMSC